MDLSISGEQLRALRKRRGLTQPQLADRTGISQVWSHLLSAVALVLAVALLTPAPIPAAAAPRCADYSSQAEAQAAYRADPVGLARLDADRDGIACERNPAPRDLEPVPLPAEE